MNNIESSPNIIVCLLWRLITLIDFIVNLKIFIESIKVTYYLLRIVTLLFLIIDDYILLSTICNLAQWETLQIITNCKLSCILIKINTIDLGEEVRGYKAGINCRYQTVMNKRKKALISKPKICSIIFSKNK